MYNLRKDGGRTRVQEKMTKLYREIQVLGVLNNCILKTSTLVLTLIVIFLVASSITLFVKLDRSLENALALAFFLLVGIQSFIFLLICLGGMSGPYVESGKVIETFKREVLCTKTKPGFEYKWLQRFVRSCAPVKVKIGENNFIERETPLKCVDVAFNITLNLLLLSAPATKS